MKLFTFLLLIICISTHGNGFSQQVSLSQTNAGLEKIFKEIHKQTGYTFVYTRSLLKKSRNISINIQNASIEKSLDICFKDQPLTYTILNTMVVIKEKEITVPKEAVVAEPPTAILVAGKVTDSKGQPLEGATILVKGTSNGVKSDAGGNFSIDAAPNATLVISFVGFEPAEVKIGNQTSITVQLKPSSAISDEVMIVGYGKQKKENLTGAISYVSSEVLESRPITNLGQGLQGIVPNLNIDPISGAPGRGASFNIRGNTSINGGSPLILVDGVEMDPNLINPQDIQSISVLKDAASASIYGARAAYGVILITMKSGTKSKKPVVSLLMNYAMNKPTVIPKSMNSMEYTSWMNDGSITSNGHPYFDDETMQHIKAYFEDPEHNSPLFQHSQQPDGLLLENGNTNWGKELFRNAYPLQQYTASASGGSDKVTYYTSFGYLNQKGISRPGNENFNRYNLVQNLSYDVSRWINISAKVIYNATDQLMNPSNSTNSSSFGGDLLYSSYSQWPIVPVVAPDGRYDESFGYNMVAYLKEGGYQKQQTQDLRMAGALKMTPAKGLAINLDYTYDKSTVNYLNYQKQYTTRDHGATLLSPWGNINAVTRNNTNNKYVAFNAYIEYEKNLGKHYLKALAGFNQEFGGNNWFQAQRRNLINNDIPYINVATGDQYAYDATSEIAIRGVFSRLNYSFNNRYLIELDGRYDGSSRFPKDNRFAFFPSVSAGWRIANEGFFAPLRNVINDLKLRASYGNLGNQAVSSYYPYIATYGIDQVNYLFGGNSLMTVYAPGLVSPTLTWEKVAQYNIGIDFSILENKLGGSIDIYERKTTDMLTKAKSLPSVLGTNEPQTNAADLRTRGFEATLSWKQTTKNGLRYGLNLVLSDYISTITKYDNPKGILSDYYVGMKLGEIWGLETAGLFKSDEEAQALDQSEISGHQFLAGDLKFNDINNDKKITRGSQTLTDHGDLKIIGNATPRYSYGFRANAEWKGFDMTVFFQGIGKRDVLPNSIYFLQHYTSEWAVPQKINSDYWRPDNQDAYFPRARIGNAPEITLPQTRFLQNAAYIRLKQLTLGYSISQALLTRLNISSIRIYLSGNNIWESTKMLDIFDPEASATNVYPLTRSFSLGMNLTF